MISTRHGFVFVHIPRTGGTSVEVALADCADEPLGRTAHGNTVLPHKHASARALRDLLGAEAWARSFRFSVVRNPWARMLSDYHFFRAIGPDLYPEFSPRERQLVDEALRLSFDDWLSQHAELLNMCQLDYLTDADGGLLVDYICRLEQIEADFAVVCQRIGVQARLPWINQTRHPAMGEAYTPASAALVARYCARDIERFGYRFEPAPGGGMT